MTRCSSALALSLIFAASATACAGAEGEPAPFFSLTDDGTETAGDEVGTDTGESGDTGTTTSDTGESTTTSDTDTTTTTDTDTTTTTDTDTTTTTGDPPCARYRYTYSYAMDSWDQVPLDAVWTGANAPPCGAAPTGAAYLEELDQLIVFASDGMFYRRVSGAWQTPVAIADKFGVLAGEPVRSVYTVPSTEGEAVANVTIMSEPQAFIYDLYDDGSATYIDTVQLMPAPDEPPQLSETSRWAATLADPDLLGDAQWWQTWFAYTDGKIYLLNGAFEWTEWLEQDSPLFMAGDAPDAASLEAAWGDHGLQRAYFVGP